MATEVDTQHPQCSGIGGQGPHDRRAEALLVRYNRQARTV